MHAFLKTSSIWLNSSSFILISLIKSGFCYLCFKMFSMILLKTSKLLIFKSLCSILDLRILNRDSILSWPPICIYMQSGSRISSFCRKSGICGIWKFKSDVDSFGFCPRSFSKTRFTPSGDYIRLSKDFFLSLASGLISILISPRLILDILSSFGLFTYIWSCGFTSLSSFIFLSTFSSIKSYSSFLASFCLFSSFTSSSI